MMPLPAEWLIVAQLPFLPLLAWFIGRDLVKAGKRDNYPVLLVIALLAGCQLMTLAGMATDNIELQRRGALAALWVVGALMSVIGGRVIPFFIQRGLDRLPAPATSPWPTRILLVGGLLAALSFAAGLNDVPSPWLSGVFLVIAGLHLQRLWRWHDRGIWGVPLLWSLYLAYAWLVVATLAMSLWHAGLMSQQSLASHSLAVGGVGGLILAMIARVGLGHTGRALTPSKLIVLGFALLMIAGACRVLLVPFSTTGLGLSALLWCAAFVLFLVSYTPILLRARV
jgi:uncharacterized protein involved in response to NO